MNTILSMHSNLLGVNHHNKGIRYIRMVEFMDSEVSICSDEDDYHDHNYKIIFCSLFPEPHDRIMRLMFIIDALKRTGVDVGNIKFFIPYLPYMRSDKVDRYSCGSIGIKVIFDMLYNAGVRKIITLDMHSPLLAGFFNGQIEQLEQSESDFCISKLIVYPDQGAFKNYYKYYHNYDHVAVNKVRRNSGVLSWFDLDDDSVKDRDCLIVDDMVSSGVTLCQIAEKLMEAGASDVQAKVTHAVLPGNAMKSIEESCISKLYITDSIPFVQSSSKVVVQRVVNDYINNLVSEHKSTL